MDIGDVIGDAVRYPSQDWKNVIILGIISILSFLIIPAFIVGGYFFRIIKATIAGSDELPEFDDWGEMFIDGLKLIIVGIIYAIPIFIISAILGLGQSAVMNMTTFSSVAIFGIIAGSMVQLIVGIIIGLVAYIAVAHMAYYDGDLGAAFRFSEILDVMSRIGWADYIIWYIVMVILGLVVGVVSVILIFPLFIGLVVVPLIVVPFWIMLFARSLALAYSSQEMAYDSQEYAYESSK